ncbi:MAG: ASCH domain-containing protein [Alphaproteobacteria bacterium]|nr:ASCH domain-containing protein [Alphaproteobacteria bacterium]
MHTMKVQTKYYHLLKQGTKRVELRLYDEKRQQIKVGDEIQFSDLSDAADTFMARVVALHRAPDFRALCDIVKPELCGFHDAAELVQIMEQFYPADKQKQYGVVGIEIEKE